MLLTQHGLRRQQAELPVGVYTDVLILLETKYLSFNGYV